MAPTRCFRVTDQAVELAVGSLSRSAWTRGVCVCKFVDFLLTINIIWAVERMPIGRAYYAAFEFRNNADFEAKMPEKCRNAKKIPTYKCVKIYVNTLVVAFFGFFVSGPRHMPCHGPNPAY